MWHAQDATALIWGYEADHPFRTQAEVFAANGIPFYVVPGTSSWNSIGGRTGGARVVDLRRRWLWSSCACATG